MDIENRTHPPDPRGDLEDPRRPVVGFSQDRSEPHVIPWHAHHRAQLLYASRGVMSVETADGTWLVPPEQAVWVPPRTRHRVRARGPLSMRSLYVHPEAAAGLPGTCCVVNVAPLLRELVLAAAALAPERVPGGREARLVAVLLDQLRDLAPAPLHLPLPADPRIAAITRRLLADPADRASLAQHAHSVGASVRTVARLFVRETGMSFRQWRQRLRLLESISRLGTGDTVTRVALDLGYGSASAFVAMFRRETGVPPGHYLGGRR